MNNNNNKLLNEAQIIITPISPKVLGEYTYSSISQRRLEFLHYKNKSRGGIFEKQSIRERFC